MTNQPPTRTWQYDALEAFLGEWRAEGTSYGGTDQSGSDPRANGESWVSRHRAYWHTGSFFMVQDERAVIAGRAFDTLEVMGVNPDSGDYFARTFENHGYYRDYRMVREGDVWTTAGETERAHITFEDNGRTQRIVWEWKPGGQWLPLCDRIATRTG